MPNGEDTKVKLPEDYMSMATEQALAQLLEEYEPAEEDIRKRLEAQIQARTPQKPWYAPILAPLAWAFEPVEPVFKTISAAAARPFTMGPGSYFGKQPYTHEIVEAYEEWKNPTKFVFDVAPYFLVPSAGQLATGLRASGTLGKYGATLLEPAVFAEQILGTGISLPFKLAGKIGRNIFFKPTYIPPVGGGAGIAAGDIIPLQAWAEAQAIATKPTAFRRFGQLPGVKQILSHVAPSSIAEGVFDVSVATRNQLLFEAGNRVLLDTAPLRRLGTAESLWGKVNKENVLTTGTFKDKTVQEIQEFPQRYWDKMTPAQQEYTTLSQKLEASRTQYLKDSGIFISKTDLEAGQVYAGRTAMIKILADGTTIDIGFVGGKLPGEVTVAGNRVKPRLFRTVEEGMADGYRYFDHFTSLEFRIGASYRRVIDKQWQEYLLNEIPTRTTKVGGAVGRAKQEVSSRMAALKQLEGIILKLETQTKIKPFQWRGIKSYYEAQYNALRSMAKKPPKPAAAIPKAEAGVPEAKIAAKVRYWGDTNKADDMFLSENPNIGWKRGKGYYYKAEAHISEAEAGVPKAEGVIEQAERIALQESKALDWQDAIIARSSSGDVGDEFLAHLQKKVRGEFISEAEQLEWMRLAYQLERKLPKTLPRGEPWPYSISDEEALRLVETGQYRRASAAEVDNAYKKYLTPEEYARVNEIKAIKGRLPTPKELDEAFAPDIKVQAKTGWLESAPEFEWYIPIEGGAKAVSTVEAGVAKLITEVQLPSGTMAEIVETQPGRIWEIRVRGEKAGTLIEDYGRGTVFGGGEAVAVESRAVGFAKLLERAREQELGILRREAPANLTPRDKAILGGEAEAGVAKKLLEMKKFIVSEREALVAFKKKVSADYAPLKMIVGHRQAIESTSRLFPGRIITAGKAPSGRVVTEQETRAFSEKLAKELNKRFNTPLDMVNKVNDLLRFFQLAGDYSLLGIQLLFFSAANPHKVPQVMGAMTSALLSPARHANGLIRRAELYARYPNIVISHAARTEMTRVMGRGGLAESRILTVPRKVLSPFARAFEGGMDEAGGLLLESLDRLGTTAAARADIGDFVNAFRGVHSSARLGVSAEWKAWERASLLAPQYLRASVSLLAMTAQGGLRGELARRNLAKALMSLTLANITISLARGEEWDEIIEHLNPSSRKFYLWGIGNQMVGPGSKPMAFVRLIANMTDDPGSLWTLSMSNPGLRFVRYSLAPVPGKAIDFLTGENPVGYPTREGALDFLDEIVASSLTPIWLQSMIFEGGTVRERVVRGTGDFWGLRAFPEAGWDRLKRYAVDTYGVAWDDLQPWEQDIIIQSPEGREFINLMEDRSPEFVERMAIRWKYKDQQEVRDMEFRMGRISISEWIDDYSNAQALRATELKRFDEDFRNMWDNPKSPNEKALSDYYTLQQGFVSEESGRFDYEGWAIAEAKFLTELDPIIREYVELNISASGRTALTQAFRYDKAQLEEYWALTDMIKAKYPSGAAIADELNGLTFEEERRFLTSNREYKLYVTEIERLRKFYRQSSPEIEAILKFWYKPALVINDNPEAVRLYNEKVAEWRLEE